MELGGVHGNVEAPRDQFVRGAFRQERDDLALAMGDDNFSQDVRAGIVEAAEAHGMEIVIDDKLPDSFTDMSATLAKVKALKPDLLLISGHDKGALTASRQIAEQQVDVPMVAVSTVTSVIEAWRRTRAPIVRPAIGDRHGHPVIFDRALFDELRRAPLEAGAKSVVRAHEPDILNVIVDDEGCLTDVDTPEDYRRITGSG